MAVSLEAKHLFLCIYDILWFSRVLINLGGASAVTLEYSLYVKAVVCF